MFIYITLQKKSKKNKHMWFSQNRLRIRLHPSREMPVLRIKTQQPEEKPDFFTRSRQNFKKISQLSLKLKQSNRRYQSEIDQILPAKAECKLQIFQLLHSGQFSKVYKVRNIDEGKDYALKKTQMTPNIQKCEQAIIRTLRNNFLAEIKDVYPTTKTSRSDPPEVNILMNLYHSTLKDVILNTRPRYGQMDDLEYKILFYQMLRGVHYLHFRGLCHRNIKPSVFLLDRNQRVFLGGLGTVKKITKGTNLSCDVGSLDYSAPQLLMGNEQYTKSIDIWSLGVIFVQLLTGKQLFKGSSFIDCLLNIAAYLGSKELKKIPGDEQTIKMLPRIKGSGLDILLFGLQPLLKDLIDNMLVINASKRISTIDALAHPYFDDLRDQQVFMDIARSKNADLSDFFDFSPVQLRKCEQYYTRLIPVWRRQKPERYASKPS